MNAFDAMTDDQMAIVGCAAALLFSGGLMVASHSVRQWFNRHSTTRSGRPAERTNATERQPASTASATSSERKAA